MTRPKLSFCEQTRTLVEQVIQVWSHTHTHTHSVPMKSWWVRIAGQWTVTVMYYGWEETGGDNRGASPWNWRRRGCRASKLGHYSLWSHTTNSWSAFLDENPLLTRFPFIWHHFCDILRLGYRFTRIGCFSFFFKGGRTAHEIKEFVLWKDVDQLFQKRFIIYFKIFLLLHIVFVRW